MRNIPETEHWWDARPKTSVHSGLLRGGPRGGGVPGEP